MTPPLEPPPSPLLPFPAAIVKPRDRKPGGFPSQPRTPAPQRQNERLKPRFQALQDALNSATLSGSTAAPDPETMVVFEVAGTITNFVRAVRNIEGLEFITDFVEDDTEATDDFYYVDASGEPNSKPIPQTLYLVMTNEKALNQLVSLFQSWKADQRQRFPRGLAPFKQVFKLLKDVRRWGPRDRIAETGLYEKLREDIGVKGPNDAIRVEIELIWRSDPTKRDTSQKHVEQALAQSNAELIRTCTIPSIKYHALLVDIPATEFEPVLRDMPQDVQLLCAESVLFVNPSYPMSLKSSATSGYQALKVGDDMPSGSPKAALLDGYPFANHTHLAGRLSIDDPYGVSDDYPVRRRVHGTAMASLVIHGDLNDPGSSLSAPIYVRPVMVPTKGLQDGESMPPDRLFTDVMHEAFQRLCGGQTPAAPSVRIVNVSLGDPARMFIRHISPTARLLDYLAHKHNLVVIVSAGNHSEIRLSAQTATESDPIARDFHVRKELHENRRNRRILSPAEAVNAITVGALHTDSADPADIPDTSFDPLLPGSVAAYSPMGPGYRRSPKPEIYAPGGRMLYQRPTTEETEISDTHSEKLHPAPVPAVGPGLLVAAPGSAGMSGGSMFSSGTSDAAALITRSAHYVLDTLESLSASEDPQTFPDAQYHPVLVKTLLAHATMWPEQSNRWADHLDFSGYKRKRGLTEYIGFGVLDSSRLASATSNRVTLIGAGSIQDDDAHTFEFHCRRI